MKPPVRRAVAAVAATVAGLTLGPVGLLIAAAFAGALIVDACWQDKASELRNQLQAERQRYEALDREAQEYYLRMREAEGRALAVDLVERAN